MMAEFPQERGGSQTGYESRLASLAMEITRMNMSDQEFLRSLLSSGPVQNRRSPCADISSSANTSRVAVPTHSSPQAALSHIPALTHCATLVPPKFSIFSGEGQKHESYPQWRSEVSGAVTCTKRPWFCLALGALSVVGRQMSFWPWVLMSLWSRCWQNLMLGLGMFGHVIELGSSSSLQGNCRLSLCLFGGVD